jgi:RNA polymerase sigma factor (sigma-70 family)
MSALAYRSRSRKECLSAESDQRLVELARGGSVDAFEAIVLRYRQPLLRHCRRMLTPAEAEDAVQEAFLAAHRTIARTSPELRLGGWLFRIAHNASLGILGRRVSTASLDAVPVFGESADDVVMRQERLRDAFRAISGLPEIERRVLVERVFGGSSHREIAIGVGRSEGAVRQLLCRARTRLRECAAGLALPFVRLLSASGDDRFAGVAFAAKGGVIFAVGVSAVGGGAAFLSGGSARSGSHPTDGGHPSRPTVGAARAAGVAFLGHTTVIDAVTVGSEQRPHDRRGARAMQPESVMRMGGGSVARTHHGSVRRGIPIEHRGSAAAASGGVSRNPGTSGSQPVAGPGVPETAAASTESHTGVAPAGSHTASTRRPGAAPGRSGAAPGRSGAAPGRSGAAPGQSGATPGQSGATPGQSGAAPGQSGATPGASGASSRPQRSATRRDGEVVLLGAQRAPASRDGSLTSSCRFVSPNTS